MQLNRKLHHAALLALTFLWTGKIQAQNEGGGTGEGGGDIDVNVDMNPEGNWYSNWWIWIIGLAVFIIIIVAIVSAGKRN